MVAWIYLHDGRHVTVPLVSTRWHLTFVFDHAQQQIHCVNKSSLEICTTKDSMDNEISRCIQWLCRIHAKTFNGKDHKTSNFTNCMNNISVPLVTAWRATLMELNNYLHVRFSKLHREKKLFPRCLTCQLVVGLTKLKFFVKHNRVGFSSSLKVYFAGNNLC